ncbi:hypothetical protein TRFO_29053 [Tritrichomonas foetus]|uniref:Uncharacterized protein n=1 Tax=Tritrichomonas foetus TaxID=1144522 RepID=A0A1J4K1D6_9EUKA|nr:hypothetical protein TRFO_29053 [Tritrichomonas foetus]|eukprot:OHT03556.1 hypothetical protein TRFO_29053 [Tritrichomonas foetus]
MVCIHLSHQIIFPKRPRFYLSSYIMIPTWLNNRLYFLKTQGRMNLASESRVDLSIFGNPELSKQFAMMKYLDLSRTPLTSVDGLVHNKRLKHFTANKSHINTLRNFRALRSVDSVCMLETPISKHPTFKLSLLLVIGDHLHTIDNQLISQSLRDKAKTYSPIAADLINAGWMAEYPCPPVETLNQLCQQYGIQPNPKATNPIDLQVYSYIDKNMYTGDFETTLQKLKRKHEEMLKQGQALFGLIDDDADNKNASTQITSILNAHGMNVDPNDDDAILETVKELCNQISAPSSP